MLRVFYIVQVVFLTLGFKLSYAMEKASEELKVGQVVLINPERLESGEKYEAKVTKAVKTGGFKIKYLRKEGKKCDSIKYTYKSQDLITSVPSYKDYYTGKRIIDSNNRIYKIKVIFNNGMMRVHNPNYSPTYFDINNDKNISPEVDFLGWLNKKAKFYLGGMKKSHDVDALFENGMVIFDYKNENKYKYIHYSKVFPDPRPTLKQIEKEDISSESEKSESIETAKKESSVEEVLKK